MRRGAKTVEQLLMLIAACVVVFPAVGADSAVTRSAVNYTIPEVRLVREDGKSVSLPDELNDGRPVVMNFVFTTCTTICPLLSQTLERLQAKLGAERDGVHLVSITIDPEEDTPERLAEYAKRFSAGRGWQFYTGTVQAILSTVRAFNVFRGDKMGHTPLTLLRMSPGQPWIRFDGFVSADDLASEIRSKAVAAK